VTTVDPALVAAVVEALKAQQAVGQLAPMAQGVPTHTVLCCRLCGHELSDAQFGTYLGHCAANHHSLIERFAGPVDGADLDASASLPAHVQPDRTGLNAEHDDSPLIRTTTGSAPPLSLPPCVSDTTSALTPNSPASSTSTTTGCRLKSPTRPVNPHHDTDR